jgi:hypothetical protein
LSNPPELPVRAPVLGRNADGRLELFAVTGSGVASIWQNQPGGAWHDGWARHQQPPGADGIVSLRASRNADGREHLFIVVADGALWQSQQIAVNNGWGAWEDLHAPDSTALLGEFTVGVNQDGRQEAFATASDGAVWQIWQTAPNGTWSDWRRLGRPETGIHLPERITIGRNEDGRQELFVIGNDGACWHVWQVAPNGGWSPWASLGRPRDTFDGSEPPKNRDLTSPRVLRNADGHLEVFSAGNGAFCNRWQERWRDGPDAVTWRHQGWNAKPPPSPDVALVWLDGALNAENRIEVVGLADDGNLWHAWQVDTVPFWSPWHSLDAPSTGIRSDDGLAVGTNADGSISAVVTDHDGAAWHIQQGERR